MRFNQIRGMRECVDTHCFCFLLIPDPGLCEKWRLGIREMTGTGEQITSAVVRTAVGSPASSKANSAGSDQWDQYLLPNRQRAG